MKQPDPTLIMRRTKHSCSEIPVGREGDDDIKFALSWMQAPTGEAGGEEEHRVLRIIAAGAAEADSDTHPDTAKCRSSLCRE